MKVTLVMVEQGRVGLSRVVDSRVDGVGRWNGVELDGVEWR